MRSTRIVERVMGRLRLACVGLVALLSAACAGVPFDPVERVPVGDVDPGVVRTRFAAAVPRSFELLNTVVFRIYGREISAMGAVAVDVERGEFELACMTPVGVKLFEVSGDATGIRSRFSLEGFLDQYADADQVAMAVGGDVRTIYFDLVPPPDAAVEVCRDVIVFAHSTPAGQVECEFAGRDLLLVEKRLVAPDGETTRVRFYDYAWHGGHAFARGVVLDNGRYGYRLIVRIKEILDG